MTFFEQHNPGDNFKDRVIEEMVEYETGMVVVYYTDGSRTFEANAFADEKEN